MKLFHSATIWFCYNHKVGPKDMRKLCIFANACAKTSTWGAYIINSPPLHFLLPIFIKKWRYEEIHNTGMYLHLFLSSLQIFLIRKNLFCELNRVASKFTVLRLERFTILWKWLVFIPKKWKFLCLVHLINDQGMFLQ